MQVPVLQDQSSVSNQSESSTNDGPSDKVPLLTIPAELRVRIYEFVFSDALIRTLHASTRPIHIIGRHQRIPVDLHVFRPRTAILAVCHVIRSEALPVYAGRLIVRTSYSGLNDLYSIRMAPFLRQNVHNLVINPVCGGCDRAMHLPPIYSVPDGSNPVFPNLRRVVLETEYAKDYFALESSGFEDGRCKCVVIRPTKQGSAQTIKSNTRVHCAAGIRVNEEDCTAHRALNPLRVDHWPDRTLRNMWAGKSSVTLELVIERELFATAQDGVRPEDVGVCYRLRTIWDYDTKQKLGQWMFCGNTGRSQQVCACGAGGQYGWNCNTGGLEDVKQVDWAAAHEGKLKEHETWMQCRTTRATGQKEKLVGGETKPAAARTNTAGFFRIR